MRNRFVSVTVLSMMIGFATQGVSEVRLPKVFSDHGVLQRDRPLHIWGWADPGETVAVEFNGQSASAVANDLGHWSLYLPPMPAGGPYKLEIKGSSKITLSDLYLGDVWIASGQSNMEMPLRGFIPGSPVKNSAEEILHANLPNVRLFNERQAASPIPLKDLDGKWTLCTPDTAAWFSAAGYFFGREIAEHEHVMIGMVDSTWGGTAQESWLSMEGLAASGVATQILETRGASIEKFINLDDEKARDKRIDQAAIAKGETPAKRFYPDMRADELASLYNGMIAPWTPYAIKGVIWYQGETNTALPRAPYYGAEFAALIKDWRSKWAQGNFPFIFVQLTNHVGDAGWSIVRDAERQTLDVANTGMAVTLDVGSAVTSHPPDKQAVGHRLALAARVVAYGEDIEDLGPLYRQVTPADHALVLWIDHAENMHPSSGKLEGFEVAGSDGKFQPADAVIEGSSIRVSSASVKNPVVARYGGAAYSNANLVNGSELPAASFISDTISKE